MSDSDWETTAEPVDTSSRPSSTTNNVKNNSDWNTTNDNMDTTDRPATNIKRDNDDNNAGGERRRRRNDDQQNDNQQNNDQQGGFQRRRRENNNGENNQENNGRRRNYNNNNAGNNADFGGRRNRQDNNTDADQQNGGGERRRRNFDNNQQEGGNNERRRRNDGDQQEGGGERRRRNDGNQQEGGERRRRNDGNQPEDAGNGDEPPKEKYVPRKYNKEDEDLFESVGEGINFSKFDNIPVQLSGDNLPAPISKFSEIAKHPSVIEAIKKSGYSTLTPVQKYGISVIMNGRDLMASAQTGSGKTMAFLLPIVENLLQDDSYKEYGDKCSPQALIVTPTRELAIQIYEQAMKLCFQNDLRVEVLYGGTVSREQQHRIKYGANIVVATTGRLLDFLEKDFLKLEKIKYFVLDEADRMIDQGFMPSVQRIGREFDMPEKDKRHTVMFSATFPSEVQRMAQQFLKEDYVFLSVGILGVANSDIVQQIREVEFKEKRNELTKILKEIYKPTERILVFCEKKKMADFLAGRLLEDDFKSTSIHGLRLQSQRELALNTFKKGETPVLVATSVAARGLDIKGVNYVINYDLPKDIDEYVHRIGRTGRVGNSGTAISFFNPKDDHALGPHLVEMLKGANQPVPDFLKQYDQSSSAQNDNGERDTRHDDVDANISQINEQHKSTAADEDDDW